MRAMKRITRFLRARLLLVVPVLALVALSSWAVASPVGGSPDDDFHLASIWCANGVNQSACQPGDSATTRYIPESLNKSPLCYRFQGQVSAACQAESFTFDPAPTYLSDRGSYDNNYPPLYYLAMNVFVSPDIQTSIIAMRIVNIVLFLAVTSVLFLLLPLRLRPVLLWSWLVSIVPLGVFVLSSNNPSAWAMIGVGSAWLALLGFFETERKQKIGLGVTFAVTSVMASGARADAAIYMGLSIALVLLLAFRREKDFYLRAILPVVFGIVALIFYLASGQSAVAGSGLGSVEDLGPTKLLELLLTYNLINLPDLWAGVFGTWSLGWLDIPMPPLVVLGGVTVFIGVVFLAITRLTWRKGVALAIVAITLIALPMFVLYQGNNLVGEVLQPRYLLPLILLLAGLALLPVRGRMLRLNVTQLVLIGGLLATANAVALHITIRRYVTGLEVHLISLNAGVEWWWTGGMPSPMVVWMIGTLTFGAAVSILLWSLARPVVEQSAAVGSEPERGTVRAA